MRALIIVDVQPDFCPGGALATARGTDVAEAIATAVESHGGTYAAIVTTQDWHIDPGPHFSPTPDYVDSWPVHCQAGTPGAELHPALLRVADMISARFHKGLYSAAYSGFEGRQAGTPPEILTPDEEDTRMDLAAWLHSRGVTAVDVCGIATDFCVKATALDAVRAGLETRLLRELCSPVAAESEATALEEMAAAGITLV
ncbi:nicotinamidase [Corynebacterium sp. 13CS0277]|uniref:isochorismatase family protein n=1 Tax=Corynebacterium sp. 13CS0277 TaxID=2071994 RepID=UPI000D0460BB|nr:isochorismatase family protein [Corynebacterium sp. 13CS0277]PRQ10819.1 nicotinamidase [Corynebacterium sp. 13CS0277]